MNSFAAMMMGMANQGKPLKVFDWNKAAELIAKNKPNRASAGLAGDWEYTGGSIYCDGKPVNKDDTYVYLASTWATPELSLDGEIVDCYIMQDEVPEEWGKDYADIYWPESALKILADAELADKN